MPLSVSLADMSGDGSDIVTMDVLGYLDFLQQRNQEEPKFTMSWENFFAHAQKDPLLDANIQSAARRIFATDILKSGRKIWWLNYLGEVLLVPNSGSAQSPVSNSHRIFRFWLSDHEGQEALKCLCSQRMGLEQGQEGRPAVERGSIRQQHSFAR
jgi:hypothetical protein